MVVLVVGVVVVAILVVVLAVVIILVGGQVQQTVGVDEILVGVREGVVMVKLLVRAGGGRVQARLVRNGPHEDTLSVSGAVGTDKELQCPTIPVAIMFALVLAISVTGVLEV